MLLFIIFTCAICFPVVGGISAEYNLTRSLLANYIKSARPVKRDATPVNITLDVAFIQLVDLDEPSQILTASIWLRVGWTDEFLSWNATEHGVSSIILPHEEVWLPDITLYSNAHDEVGLPVDRVLIVYSSGYVLWLQPAVIRSQCTVDALYFPYDRQVCSLEFGSWVYHGFQVDIFPKNPHGDIANFRENGEWVVESMPAKRKVTVYGCCPEPYPTIAFYVVLKRFQLFYMFNLFLPCALFTVLSFFVFWLPSDSGEKMGMAVTLLLSLTVFMILASEYLPPSSANIPLISRYFFATIMLLSFCVASTVCILRIHHRGSFGVRAPFWLRKLAFVYFARFLCLRHLTLKHEARQAKMKKKKLESTTTLTEDLESVSNGNIPNGNGPGTELTLQRSSSTTRFLGNETTCNNGNATGTELTVQHSCSTTRFHDNETTCNHDNSASERYFVAIKQQLDAELEESLIVSEWKEIADILDKLFMLLFLIISLMVNIIVVARFYLHVKNDLQSELQ